MCMSPRLLQTMLHRSLSTAGLTKAFEVCPLFAIYLPASQLALDPLEGLASLGLARLLAFHHTGVTRQEAICLEDRPEVWVPQLQRLTNPMPDSLYGGKI